MPKVTIKDVHRNFDGEYDLAMGADAPLKNRELHIIKQISGARPLEISDALATGDVDVTIALAVIALQRAGRGTDISAAHLADVLFDADAGAVVIDFREDAEAGEREERPPGPSPTTSGDENSLDVENYGSESTTPSGPTSPTDGGSREPTLRAIGEAG